MKADKIIIIDFGSQYTRLIARKVRELEVYCEIFSSHNFDISSLQKDAKSVSGLILSGSPASVYDKTAPKFSVGLLSLNKPVLGICYGLHLISYHFKGEVHSGKIREYGKTEISLTDRSELFKGVESRTTVWMSHGDTIKKLPEGFKVTSRSLNGLISSFEFSKKKIYAVQFHPEVTHTKEGTKILRNFLFKICKVKNKFIMGSFVNDKVRELKEVLGGEKALCALSGGVDSAVAAYLVNRAIGDNLICIHIDNGLMRKNESREIVRFFSSRLNLKFIDASEIFLRRLKGITDPEKKRKIIGKTFIDVFQDFAKKYNGIKYLVQGTLYPDVIESSSEGGPSVTIKTHHNVGGLPSSLKMKLVEPLRDLFKDEVRKLGKILKVPDKVLLRHPFPGPGLAVRIISDITREKLEILREADYIYTELLRKKKLYDKIWQAFAVLLPVSTVGVMGDARTYEKVLALRAVNSYDGMTAEWYKMPLDVLEEISSEITNKVKGINRVVYDVSNKPPSTIEWE